MDNHIQHFYQTGELLKGTYYFDPPLVESEIEILYNILRYVKGSKIILNPLSQNVRMTGNYNFSRTLLWLDVYNNTIKGWQNVDTGEDEEGNTYTLNDLASIKRWCATEGDCVKPFHDGRLFLTNMIDTEDIFNQLNEF